MVKVGVIGLGFMGQMHLSCYEKINAAHVVAVADSNVDALLGNKNIELFIEMISMFCY